MIATQTDQGLIAADLAFGVEDALQVQLELASVEGTAQPLQPVHGPRRLIDLARAGFESVHTVASHILCHVDRGIGLNHQRHGVCRSLVNHREACADAQCEGMIFEIKAPLSHRIHQFLGARHCHRGIDIVQDHREFIASHTRQQVRRLQDTTQHTRHVTQQLVAGNVSVRVVDYLEMINIQIQQRVLAMHHMYVEHRLGQREFESSAVWQAGQRIVHRLVGKPLGHLMHHADIVKHKDAADQRTVAVAQRRHRIGDRAQATVLALQACEERDARALPALQHVRHRTRQRLAILR